MKKHGKDVFSKSITGIKLQNNKNLFIFRNDYYKLHCDQFNSNISNAITKYNKERFEELEYKHKWDEMMKKVKEAIAPSNEGEKDKVTLNNK